MQARSAAASVVRHIGGAAAEALLIAALVALLALVLSPVYVPAKFLAGTETTLAAKGGNHAGTYSIAIVGPAGAAPTVVRYGSVVTTLSTYGNADPAYARLRCTANDSTLTNLATGDQVYDVFKSIREGSWNTGGYASFDTTVSPAWTGGGADCTASLMTARMHNADRVWKTLASISFSVMP